MRLVAVTGLGAISPLGVGVQHSWKHLIAGKCGIQSLKHLGPAFQKLRCQVGGLVPNGNRDEGGWSPSEWMTSQDERRTSRHMQFALAAANEALEDARWNPLTAHGGVKMTSEEKAMTGVSLGTGIGSFEDVYDNALLFAEKGASKISPWFVPRLLNNLAAGHVSMKYGFRGPNLAPNSACSTGAHAIADAARLIATGEADVMVAGAAESCIHPLAFAGFERLKGLTTSSNEEPQRASRPFSDDRDGFVIGEGAGVMVLEEYQHATKRKAKILALLAGHASTADAHHPTQPLASGESAARCMHLAIHRAKAHHGEVDWFNAHATATPVGDVAENRAIKALMEPSSAWRSGGSHNDRRKDGLDGGRWKDVCVSSTKGATGHLLGAAGAIEAVFSVCAIVKNTIPPTLNLHSYDKAEFPFNYVGNTALEKDVNVVLTNSFGFGGTNASLCFRAPSPTWLSDNGGAADDRNDSM